MKYRVTFDMHPDRLVTEVDAIQGSARESVVAAAVDAAGGRGYPVSADSVSAVYDDLGNKVLSMKADGDLARRVEKCKHYDHTITSWSTGSWSQDVQVDLEDNSIELGDYEYHSASSTRFWCQTCGETVDPEDLGLDEGYDIW